MTRLSLLWQNIWGTALLFRGCSPTLDLNTEGGVEKMHRHCNAVTVSATLPSRHSLRMATDNITVGTTEVKHSIYYILGCRDTSSSVSQPLTTHHLRQALRTCAHSQGGGQVTSRGGCVVYTQKYTD